MRGIKQLATSLHWIRWLTWLGGWFLFGMGIAMTLKRLQ